MKLLGARSSFFYLNTAQFFVVLNDSIFRLIVAYSLIDLLGKAYTNQILALLAAIFVAPFLLFCMPAGNLADKFSKRAIILWSLWAEIAFMVFGLVAFYVQNIFCCYMSLFLVALQSAILNPSKHSILPEICPKEKISSVNGMLTLTTYLAIIAGTFLASFLTQITGRNYPLVVVFCILFSIIALLLGFGIEKTPVQDPNKKINPLFFIEVVKSLIVASKYKFILLACLCSASFAFTASYTQLNLIPFGVQSLGISEVQTGYVYLAAAIGIGVGSFIVATVSGKFVELGLSILGGIGTTTSYFLLYLFQHSLPVSCFFFFMIGVSGGMFVVPLDAYVQVTAPKENRGSIVAASSFLFFLSVLIAGAYLYIAGDILNFSAATGFLSIAFFVLIIALLMIARMPQALLRGLALVAAKFFITIEASELKKGDQFVVITQHKKLCKLALMTLLHDIGVYTYDSKNVKALQKKASQGKSFCLISNSDEKIQEIKKSFNKVKVIQFRRIPVANGSFFHFCKIASIHVDFKELK